MAWKDQHPNWRQKAAILGWGADRIARIAAGGDPGPRALAEYEALKGTGALAAAKERQVGGPVQSTTAFNESAYDLFNKTLTSWGIPVGNDMLDILRGAVIEGYTPQQIPLLIPQLEQTATWQNRFPGWKAFTANGYNQQTVGEYLALENQYHRILQAAGLPPGFYDDPSDFGKFIANNIAPEELQERVNAAVSLTNQVDPTARSLLMQFYGVGTGELAAYFLDPNRALPQLDRQYKAVNVAAYAKRAGLQLAAATRYEDLVDRGLTPQQAAQGFATVKSFTDNFGLLGQIHGISYSQSDAEEDVFFNNNEKRRKIANREVAAFSGRSGSQGGRSASTAGSY